jgi:putative ABC transport system permease protein
VLRIALRALRSRRTQTSTLVLLAALVTAAAVAAPFFVYASTERLTARDLAAAPADQRNVEVTRPVPVDTTGTGGLTEALSQVAGVLRLPGFDGVSSASVEGSLDGSGDPSLTVLSSRDQVCAHVLLVSGACPSGTGTVMISTATAASAGARTGSTVSYTPGTSDTPMRLRVAGVYRPRDPSDPYWGRFSLVPPNSSGAGGDRTTDALFGTLDTVASTRSSDVVVARDLSLRTTVLSVHDLAALSATVADAQTALKPQGYKVDSDLVDLSNQVIVDTNLVFTGVPLGAVELVLFGWFALFLAIRATAAARRFDIGVLKLRGVRQRGLWTLMTQQSLVPILAGVPIGFAGGYLGARVIAGAVRASGDVRLATLLAVAAALAAVLGGLTAALVAERRALVAPVGDLLRSTPAVRRGWRADIADLVLVVLAVAAVVQLRGSTSATGLNLAVLAPGLIAFAAGLVLARLLVPAAGRAAEAARRGGRLRGLLTATWLARRGGLDRIFALLVIAVALCGYAVMAWQTGATARDDRAAVEVGPARIMTVAPVPPDRLLAAVRASDPSGRYAMAATELTDSAIGNVLAVDSTRLAAVLPGGPGGGLDGAALARLLHPAASRDVRITGPSLHLDLDVNRLGPHKAYLLVMLTGPRGVQPVAVGPLRADTTGYTVPVTGCATAPGCGFTGFGLSQPLGSDGQSTGPADPGTSVVVRAFSVAGAPVLSSGLLADPAGWRTTTVRSRIGPAIAAGPGGLSLTMPPATYSRSLSMDPTAYLVTTPIPAPVVVAASAAVPPDPAVISPFGVTDIPVTVAATEPVLPRLETTGTLVDLDYAQALAGPDTADQSAQVWLAAGTPAAVTRALAAHGLIPVAQDSVVAREGVYAGRPDVAGLRFEVFAGAIALVVAAMALLLTASVERGPRSRELVALRRQGVPARVAAGVAHLGYAVLAGGALVAGAVSAVVVRLLAGRPPLFGDGWHVLPRPPLIAPGAVGVTVVVAAAVLAVAAGLSAAQLVHAVRRGTGEAGAR